MTSLTPPYVCLPTHPQVPTKTRHRSTARPRQQQQTRKNRRTANNRRIAWAAQLPASKAYRAGWEWRRMAVSGLSERWPSGRWSWGREEACGSEDGEEYCYILCDPTPSPPPSKEKDHPCENSTNGFCRRHANTETIRVACLFVSVVLSR